jgi:colicin import membrane protein
MLSVLFHGVVLVFLLAKLPNLFPQQTVTPMKVRLVTAQDVKKSQTRPTPVRSQQSDAPPAPPKEKPKPQPKPKEPAPTGPRVVNEQATKSVKAPELKPEPIPLEPKDLPKNERPAKLDKTPDKQSVMKDDSAKPTPEEDSFLAALDFIDDLEEKQAALDVGEDTSPATIDAATQHEIAIIKRHIERNWYRPPGLAVGGLIAMVEVHVNRDGSLLSLRITQPSGDGRFDSSLLRAVRKSVPLPIPFEKYNTYKVLDLRFGD